MTNEEQRLAVLLSMVRDTAISLTNDPVYDKTRAAFRNSMRRLLTEIEIGLELIDDKEAML